MAFSNPTSQTGVAPPSTQSSTWDYPTSPHPRPTRGRPPHHSLHYYLKSNYPHQPTCPLCDMEFATNDKSRRIRELPCGDIFHKACIDRFLGDVYGRCPACDYPIGAEWYWPDLEGEGGEDEGRGLCRQFLDDEVEREERIGNCFVRSLQGLGARMKEMCRPLLPEWKRKKLYGVYQDLDPGRWKSVERKTEAKLGGRRFGHVRGGEVV